MENSNPEALLRDLNDIDALRRHLLLGHVIPAHPLALNSLRVVDEQHQRALTRYYVAAGAGGMAVGVHTTGFRIHDSDTGLYDPVLTLASETATEALSTAPRDFVRVAGLIGNTAQAIREAVLAQILGYHCGLLSLGAWKSASDAEIIQHCRHVAEAIPLFGFYLQPAVGGRELGYSFWRAFAEIPNVVAIKVAPFNRYATLEVVRAVADSGRRDIALYTGNDDAIVADLLTDASGADAESLHFVGGLLGQWAVWTHSAVELLKDIREWRMTGKASIPRKWLMYGAALTEANAAIFDASNKFAGCLPGILEVLRRQGLVQSTFTLDVQEQLSPGQAELISEMKTRHPELADDDFVAEHIDEWLR
ncbi:MAG: dihydrodipicolinate synthase family protein [Gemmatimonadaceae bacterium]